MKSLNSPGHYGMIRNAIIACLSFPSLLLAHPGHYHPGEGDEFDALRANFLHLHGNLEIGLAAFALASVLVFGISRKRPVRIAAAIAFGGSLALLSVV